jgi:YD repeat-containing protein
MTLDPTKGMMVQYGSGTVSPDGTQVIPDLNPATPGKRYGLVHFDWHGPVIPPPPPTNDPGPCRSGSCCTLTGDPIDLSTGLVLLRETDMALSGSRGTVAIERTYRTGSTQSGPFGIGGRHNCGYLLATNTPVGAPLINLVMPDGDQFPFVRQANGTLINTTIPTLRGAVLTTPVNAQPSLRWKDGTTFHFQPRGLDIGLAASTLESIADVNGNTITLVRDAARPIRINEVLDPVGRKLTLSYDSTNRITSITDPIGRTVTYIYNSQNTLATVTDPEGGVTRYDYDSDNNVIRITDPRGVGRPCGEHLPRRKGDCTEAGGWRSPALSLPIGGRAVLNWVKDRRRWRTFSYGRQSERSGSGNYFYRSLGTDHDLSL